MFLPVATSFLLAEVQQLSVGCLWEVTVLFSAAFQKFFSNFFRPDGKPGRRLPEALLLLRGRRFLLFHSQEDELGRGLLKQVSDCVIAEPTQLGENLLEKQSP